MLFFKKKKNKKKNVETEPELESVPFGEHFEYKGWEYYFNCLTDGRPKFVEAVIKNRSLGIGFKIKRESNKETTYNFVANGLGGNKICENVIYREDKTFYDMIEEAKAIIDGFEIMEKKILEKNKITKIQVDGITKYRSIKIESKGLADYYDGPQPGSNGKGEY